MSAAIPKYRRHKNGQAFVRCKAINGGKNFYLGRYGSPESKEEYSRILKLLAAGQTIGESTPSKPDTITSLLLRYDLASEAYYTRDGKQAKEFVEMRLALRPLGQQFGGTLANEFGPKSLRRVRDSMIQAGLARSVINHRISRIKRFFAWCASEELIRPEVYHGLLSLKGLLPGFQGVREAEKVLPIARQWVELTLPHLSPTVAAMVQVQLWCGMRPGEAVQMRSCDIAMGDIWLYRPQTHKNAWRQQGRIVAIPKVAQEILKPWLRLNTQEYLFSPRDAEAWRNQHRHVWSRADRKTKVYPSELKARAKAKAARARKGSNKRECYDTDSYRRAISYGLKRAAKLGVGLPHWHPHQLRHTISTELSQTIGEQAAQRWLGHERLETTGLYTERQVSELIQIAKEIDRRNVG